MEHDMTTRRSFMAGAAAGSASLLVRPLTVFAQSAKAEFRFTQYHNQTAESSLHKRLSEMWAAVTQGNRRPRRGAGLPAQQQRGRAATRRR